MIYEMIQFITAVSLTILSILSILLILHRKAFMAIMSWISADIRRVHGLILIFDIVTTSTALSVLFDFVSIQSQIKSRSETLDIYVRGGLALGTWSFIFLHLAVTETGARLFRKQLFTLFTAFAILGCGGGYLWGRYLVTEALAHGYHVCGSFIERVNDKGFSRLAAPGVSCDVFDDRKRGRVTSERDEAAPVGSRLTERFLDVQPTLTIRPGFPLHVIMHRDLVLRPYRGG